jgi:hypothetical protein
VPTLQLGDRPDIPIDPIRIHICVLTQGTNPPAEIVRPQLHGCGEPRISTRLIPEHPLFQRLPDHQMYVPNAPFFWKRTRHLR